MILAVVVAFGAGWLVVRAWQWRRRRPAAGDFDPRHGEFLRALAHADKRGPP